MYPTRRRDADEGERGMTGTTMRNAMMMAGLAVLLGAGAARAHTVRTPPVVPGAEQKLVCTVVNVSGRAVEMSAEILDRFGDNVTDFATTDWDATGTVLTTLRIESSSPNARWCRVKAKRPARKTDVRATLQACSWDDTVCGDPVAAR
jgi:hypothetical protein